MKLTGTLTKIGIFLILVCINTEVKWLHQEIDPFMSDTPFIEIKQSLKKFFIKKVKYFNPCSHLLLRFFLKIK